MRVIPTRVHGMPDYLMGIVLIAAPCRIADGGPEQWVPVILGAIAYSLVTDYELGIARLIPKSVHLGLDLLNGILLAASSWL